MNNKIFALTLIGLTSITLSSPSFGGFHSFTQSVSHAAKSVGHAFASAGNCDREEKHAGNCECQQLSDNFGCGGPNSRCTDLAVTKPGYYFSIGGKKGNQSAIHTPCQTTPKR